jgi:cohesin loading factor subunit SCC2
MEKIVTGTGTTVAHAIETEIFQVRLHQSSQSMMVDSEETPSGHDADMDPGRIRQLTAASMILSGLWEARIYLRRLYGLMTGRKESKGKVSAKDLNKAPIKVAGVTGDKFWEEITKIMSALDSPEAMMDQCKSFVELLTVDKDFKIAAEGEDDITRARHTTPSDEEGDGPSAPPSGSGRGRKRKAIGTPSRKKRARSSSRGRSKKISRGSADSDEDAEGDWE